MAQVSGTVDSAADTLQRTGADEACCLADEEDAVFAFAEILKGSGPQNKTSLSFQRLAEVKTNFLQFFLLPFETLAGVIHGEGAAENELLVFGDGPGTAIRRFGVENAGIERVRVGLLEPLLDGKIVPDFLFGIKCPSDDGICTVSADEVFGCKGVIFFIFQIGNEKTAVLSF